MDGNDVGVIQHSGGAGLIPETAEHVSGFQAMHIQPHGFQGNSAPNGGILGLVDHPHGASAQFAGDFVSAYGLDGHQVSSSSTLGLFKPIGEESLLLEVIPGLLPERLNRDKAKNTAISVSGQHLGF